LLISKTITNGESVAFFCESNWGACS